ncbi:MAG: aspartate:proton symporter, partial [Pseudomonas sp.]
SKLGSFGGLGILGHPFDTVVVAACALGIYYWGAATGVPAHLVRLETEDDESEAPEPDIGRAQLAS